MSWRKFAMKMMTIWDWHGSLFVTEDKTERRGRGTCLQWPSNDPLSKSRNICSREYQNGDGWTDRVTPLLTRESLKSHMSLWEKYGCTVRVKKCRSEVISLWTIFKLKAGYYWTILCVRPTFDAVIKTIRAITAITPMSSDRAQAGPGLRPNATLHLIRERLDINI